MIEVVQGLALKIEEGPDLGQGREVDQERGPDQEKGQGQEKGPGQEGQDQGEGQGPVEGQPQDPEDEDLGHLDHPDRESLVRDLEHEAVVHPRDPVIRKLAGRP